MPARAGWAVAAVARRGPGMTCLVQALVVDALLRRHGFTPRLCIGVRQQDTTGPRPFESHAWVEYNGTVIVGHADDLADYGILSASQPS